MRAWAISTIKTLSGLAFFRGFFMSRLILISLFCLVCPSPIQARADDPGVPATIAHVQKLQAKSGGFKAQAAAKEEPSLRATVAAVRALHYLKGTLPDKEACVKFVAGCHDAKSGGFADKPGGQADVVSTALGLMAIKDLNMPLAPYSAGAIQYLVENTHTFEEQRLAAAALESIQAKSSKMQPWLDAARKLQKPDGTSGTDLEQARATAGVVVTILRLGGEPGDKSAILKTLRDGQRLNGGFGKGDSELAADLETTYRVMRCFMMLKAQPERIEGLRTFIAKCRNEDGGYGISPGQPSSVSATYFAAIVRHWLGE
jgi:hypothetical protein